MMTIKETLLEATALEKRMSIALHAILSEPSASECIKQLAMQGLGVDRVDHSAFIFYNHIRMLNGGLQAAEFNDKGWLRSFYQIPLHADFLREKHMLVYNGERVTRAWMKVEPVTIQSLIAMLKTNVGALKFKYEKS